MAAGASTPISRALASACVADERMMRMISSMLAWASSKPSTVCLRCRALASRNCVRRRMTVSAVADEFFQHLLERQHPRLAVDQRQEDDRERVLQRRELVELVEHDFRIGVALQLEDQAHRLFQIAFVAAGRDAHDPVFVDQLGDPFFDRDRGSAGRAFR